MATEENIVKSGIASIFEKSEIKEYFNTFLSITAALEFIIFAVHFISILGPEKNPFPWKQYFFVSLMTPLFLVFILGIIVIGFNYYLFGNNYGKGENSASGEDESGKKFEHDVKHFFSAVNQIPVLPGLFLFGVGSILIYKFDVILAYVGNVGEKAAHYIFITLIVLAACGVIFMVFWMYWKFKLQKERMQRQTEYKNKVLETSGLIILENNTVLNKEGKVVADGNLLPPVEDIQLIEAKDIKELPGLKENAAK